MARRTAASQRATAPPASRPTAPRAVIDKETRPPRGASPFHSTISTRGLR